MKVVIQRVSEASVTIESLVVGSISVGLLVFVGFEALDTEEDLRWMCSKIVHMRIFSDTDGKMNVSLKDVDGDLLLVSQFTLHASTKKGNRPSFMMAAAPELAISLYEQFIFFLTEELGKPIQTGKFGADMQVRLLNDGPVTIVVDSKNRM